MKVYILVLAIICCIALTQSKADILLEEYGNLGTKLNFYDQEYLDGLATAIEIKTGGECKNLPRRWRKKPRSVDTHGTCGLVCSEINCEGTCIRVYPAHGEQQLSTIKMDKMISSVKSCFGSKKRQES